MRDTLSSLVSSTPASLPPSTAGTGDGDEPQVEITSTGGLDKDLERIIRQSLIEIQKQDHHVGELCGNIASMARVVSVAEYERMLTTVQPGQPNIPACVYGEYCKARDIGLTVHNERVAREHIQPFRVWLTRDEENSALGGKRVPGLKGRPCAACYIAELERRAVVRTAVDDSKHMDLCLGRETFNPAFVALTCEGRAARAVSGRRDADGDGQPAEIEKQLDGLLREDAFGMPWVVGYTLLGRPAPFVLPQFRPGCMRWKVLSDGSDWEGPGDPQLVLQVDCGFMRAAPPVSSGTPNPGSGGGSRYGVSRVLQCMPDQPMLTPRPCSLATIGIQEAARASWEAVTARRTYGLDLTCASCAAHWRTCAGQPVPSLHTAYVSCFAGTAEENVAWVADLRGTVTATLEILAGRYDNAGARQRRRRRNQQRRGGERHQPCHARSRQPKSYAQKLAGMLTWLVRDPQTLDMIQPILFTEKKAVEKQRWRVPDPEPDLELDLGTDDSMVGRKKHAKTTGNYTEPLELRPGDVRVANCMGGGVPARRLPLAIAELRHRLRETTLEKTLRVALAWLARLDEMEGTLPPLGWLDPTLVVDSGVLAAVTRHIRAPHLCCCDRHCVCKMRIGEFFAKVAGWCAFPASLPKSEWETDGAIGWDDVPPLLSSTNSDHWGPCLEWVHETGPAHEEHGRIVITCAPAQVQHCHVQRLKTVAPVPAYVCPGCGESDITQVALMTKPDRRNKMIGYDMDGHFKVCRSNKDEPPSLLLPSYGSFMRVFGVWWVRCCMCLRPVMGNRCYTHWSATHVCSGCAIRSRGRITFKSALA